MSRVNWKTPLFIFIPVVLFFLFQSFNSGNSVAAIFFYFAAGVLFWTFTEYAFHRFLFHFKAKGKVGKRIIFLLHGIHHDYPNDSNRLVFPPTISIPSAAAFYLLFFFILGQENTQPFFSGFICGYLTYDTLHYALHHFTAKRKFWIRLKVRHMKHHYEDNSKGFGVSSNLWDQLLGSDIKRTAKKDS